MSLDHPLQDLAAALAHAQYKGFPAYAGEELDHLKTRETGRNVMRRFERPVQAYEIILLAMFEQNWSSTALGFGGIGGQAFTSAYTIILQGPMGDALVYFAGRFAYRVERPSQVFMQDVANRNMTDVARSGRYDRG